mmetsp:Transcript_55990/g.131023  ORF Transcript_55990/g.131023 Transcript_55990/m.131023 type:complete len:328 (-) Transcript_55990:134-1117(-)
MGAQASSQRMILASMVFGSAAAISVNILAYEKVNRAEEYVLSRCLPMWRQWSMDCIHACHIALPTIHALQAAEQPKCQMAEPSGCSSITPHTVVADNVIADVAHLILPALGPEEALRLRTIASPLRAAWDRSSIVALASTGVWSHFLRMVPSMLSLVEQKEVDRAAIQRTAALGFLSPDGSSGIWSADVRGRSPLGLAVAMRSPKVVRSLLKARCPPDSSADKGGSAWSPLMWAAHNGDHRVCHELLQARAHVNSVARDGSSALLCATRADKASLDTVTVLLAAGADTELVPMQSPFDEHIEMEVRQALNVYRQKARHMRNQMAKMS